jgi:hypothetical protein
MQLTSLIAAAGLAVSTTSAFLLPLSDSPETDTVTTLPVPFETDFQSQAPYDAEAQKLELPCPGCPVRVGHRKGDDRKAFRLKTDIPSHLELAFSIDHAADHDRLILNDFELYPRSMNIMQTLGAQVLPDHHKGGKHKLPGHRKQHKPFIQPLGYALSTSPIAMSSEDNLELIQIDLQIIEVGNVFIDGVPNVKIQVIKTPEGGLMIGGIETTEPIPLLETPMDKQEECTTMLCKWRAMLSAQMGRFRSHKCGGGRRPGHIGAHSAGHHGHPSSAHAHGGQGQHHRHRFSHLLRNIVSHILLPVAVGIAAGITASIIGMMVGTGIVYVWRTFVRPAGTRRRHHHHSRGHSSHKAVQKEAAAVDEKAGLMSQQEVDDVEAPPAYIEEAVVDDDAKQTEH